MKEFIEYIVKNLVSDPTAVAVQAFEGEKGVVVEIRVATPDIGKVVGSGGRTIKALRTIAMTIGARLGRRVRVELVD